MRGGVSSMSSRWLGEQGVRTSGWIGVRVVWWCVRASSRSERSRQMKEG